MPSKNRKHISCLNRGGLYVRSTCYGCALALQQIHATFALARLVPDCVFGDRRKCARGSNPRRSSRARTAWENLWARRRLRKAGRYNRVRLEPVAAAKQGDHRSWPRTPKFERRGGVFSGFLSAQTSGCESRERPAAVRSRQPRLEGD